MSERYKFLMAVARATDAYCELGPVIETSPRSCAVKAEVRLIGPDGREIDGAPAMADRRVEIDLPAEIVRHAHSMGAGASGEAAGVWVKGRKVGGLDVPLGAAGLDRRELARVLLAEELGSPALGAGTFPAMDALAMEARRLARDEASRDPSSVLDLRGPEETVLLDPEWFDPRRDPEGFCRSVAPGVRASRPGDCEEALERASRDTEAARELGAELMADAVAEICSWVDSSVPLGDVLVSRDYGAAVHHAMGSDPRRELAEEALERLPAGLAAALSGGAPLVADSAGTLTASFPDGRLVEVRVCPDPGPLAPPEALQRAWSRGEPVRAAELMGVREARPARRNPPIAAQLALSPLSPRRRQFGAKELRAGDRSHVATCCDASDPVASDGQDCLEYNACDDDVLAGEAREFRRDRGDLDSDGIADWAEESPVA